MIHFGRGYHVEREERDISSSMFLPGQKMSSCFAYGQWQFLRFLAIRALPDDSIKAVELSKCLETKLRQKMLELSPCKESNLGDYAAAEMERKSIKRALLTEPQRIKALCYLTLKMFLGAPPEVGQRERAFNLIDSYVSKKNMLSWKERKLLFKMIKSTHLNPNSRIPVSLISEEEFDLIAFIENEQDLWDNAQRLKYIKMLSLLNTAESHQPPPFHTSLDGNPILRSWFQNEIIYTTGLSEVDLSELLSCSYLLLEQQSTLKDVHSMAHRLINLASKQRKILQCMTSDAVKYFLGNCRFQSHEQWESTQNDILSKVKASLAESLF